MASSRTLVLLVLLASLTFTLSGSTYANQRTQSINTSVMAATCHAVHPYKLLWPDPKNRRQFLFCHIDPECEALLQKSDENATSSVPRCYSLRTEKCPAKTTFDFPQQRCVKSVF